MGAIDQTFLEQINVLVANNDTVVLPAGFINASFANLGDNDATLTMGSATWTVPKKSVYNLPDARNSKAWQAVTITATTTIVECTYYV